MWNVFEQPYTLIGAAIVVLFAVLTFRSVWWEKRRWWQWLLPLAVAAAGFGLDYAVATDREKIDAVLKAGMTAIEQEDCAAIARLLAEDYRDSYHADKAALMNRCRRRLESPAVEAIRKVGTARTIIPPEAKLTTTVFMRFAEDSYWARSYKPNAFVKLELYLRKQPDKRWVITRMEVLEVDKMSVRWGAT
jgi:hypothetical protein